MMKKINIRKLVLSLILILTLTLGTGCELLYPQTASSPTTSIPETSSPPTANITLTKPGWAPTLSENASFTLPSLADAVARVKPSVVAINTEVTAFDIFQRSFTQEGAGSGWIIDGRGYIVTNNHVVEGAQSITVTLDDERIFAANIVGTDSLTDLAVLKINAEDLPAVTVGNSDSLRVGDWVIAIGNALGQGIRATQGIVSRKQVSVQVDTGQEVSDLIETDAAINPGNSGGPMVNLAGEVIGITSIKIAQVGVEGMGYAISSNEALPIIQQLINTGYVIRPWLGVSLYTVDPYVVQRYRLATDKGAFVVTVASGSPADKAGIKPGDVITRFGNKEITNVNELIEAIHSAQVGQDVEITFWQDNTENITHATLVENPSPN